MFAILYMFLKLRGKGNINLYDEKASFCNSTGRQGGALSF